MQGATSRPVLIADAVLKVKALRKGNLLIFNRPEHRSYNEDLLLGAHVKHFHPPHASDPRL